MKKPTNKVLLGAMVLLVGIPTLIIVLYTQGCELLVQGIDVSLKRGANFAVFGGGAGITNQGKKTVITGDMGTTGASTMITGFHNAGFSYSETPLNAGNVNGAIYTNAPHGDTVSFAIATETAANILEAFNYLATLPNGIDPGAGQLGGLTLAPGVYKSASGAFLITGSDLTLDAKGDADATWVFQMASSLTVGTPTAPRSIILINGAQAKNVFWQVGSSATINGAGGGTMAGTIISSAAITFSTAGNQNVTTLNGRALAMFASVTMVNTVITLPHLPPYIAEEPLPVPTPGVTITGTKQADVVAVPGNGTIIVENNGGLVTVTETGTGTIRILNNGGILTATNTGNGVMTIDSTCTGAVTVTNTGNGNTIVHARGEGAVTYTHSSDENVEVTLPALDISAISKMSNITITGKSAADVVAVPGNGFINVINNGAHVAATETGTGTINIINNGGVLTATNTGNGVMTIDSTCTGAVTVTNTGSGNTIVHASGAGAVAYTHATNENVEVWLPATP